MLTLSAIKADVGSIGGHTQPSTQMLEVSRAGLTEAREVVGYYERYEPKAA